MLLFLVFTVTPVVMSLAIGFTDFNQLQPPSFVGLDNYIRLFLEDSIFIKALGNTLILALITGPLGYLLSFVFAWFINELRPGMRAFVTLIFYAPSISGNMYLVWQLFFSGDSYGYLNSILYQLNLISTPIVWLKNPDYLLTIVSIVTLWSSLGTSFLAFIAGLQGVDRSLYEAGTIDGIRTRFQELRFITLPSMGPQLMFAAVMQIGAAFGVSTICVALAGNPSTDYGAATIVTHLSDVGTMRYEMGYASAIATVLFITMILVNGVIKRVLKKHTNI